MELVIAPRIESTNDRSGGVRGRHTHRGTETHIYMYIATYTHRQKQPPTQIYTNTKRERE